MRCPCWPADMVAGRRGGCVRRRVCDAYTTSRRPRRQSRWSTTGAARMRPEFPSVPISCLLLLAALAAPDVEAQAQAPAPAQAEPTPTVEPDISLTATV